jgi:zinc transporter ZupT
MTLLGWIVLSGLLMSAIALVGSITLLLEERALERILLPLVAFAAGSLIGGALFHMLPGALSREGDPARIRFDGARVCRVLGDRAAASLPPLSPRKHGLP